MPPINEQVQEVEKAQAHPLKYTKNWNHLCTSNEIKEVINT